MLVAEKVADVDLSKYHTAIAVDLAVLSDRDIAMLKNYTSGGGRLIVSGPLGTRLPTYAPRSGGAAPAISGSRVTLLGFRGSELFQRFIDPVRKPALAAEFLATLDTAGEAPLRCSGPKPRGLITELPSTPSGYAIHLLNYNFNLQSADAPEETKLKEETTIPVKDLKLELRTASPIVRAVAFTAGGEVKQLTLTLAHDGWTGISAGTVNVYTVIELELERRPSASAAGQRVDTANSNDG